MLIRFMTVECTECNTSWEVAEPDEDWDDLLEMEVCPECRKKLIEAV